MLCILSSFKVNSNCFLGTRTLYGVPMIYYPFCNTVGIGYVEEFPHALANDFLQGLCIISWKQLAAFAYSKLFQKYFSLTFVKLMKWMNSRFQLVQDKKKWDIKEYGNPTTQEFRFQTCRHSNTLQQLKTNILFSDVKNTYARLVQT